MATTQSVVSSSARSKRSGLTVGDVTRTQLYSLPGTATIKDAAAELIRRDIDCIVVDTGDGVPHLLTELTLLKALLPTNDELYSLERLPDEVVLEEIAGDHAGRTLDSIELSQVPTVSADHPAMKALAQMLAHNRRRMLVTDPSGAVQGIVTQRDLLRSVLFNLHASYSS